VIGVAVVLAAFAAGCGGSAVSTGTVTEAQTNLQSISVAYMKFIQKHNMTPPKSEDEFKTWVKSLPAKELEDMRIKDKEKVFISPRDNQPYVIVPNVAMPGAGMGSSGGSPPAKGEGGPPRNAGTGKPPVVAYEKTGVGGKRMIAFLMGGGTMEVNDEQLKEYVPSAK
jgi:hypothetical protein